MGIQSLLAPHSGDVRAKLRQYRQVWRRLRGYDLGHQDLSEEEFDALDRLLHQLEEELLEVTGREQLVAIRKCK